MRCVDKYDTLAERQIERLGNDAVVKKMPSRLYGFLLQG